ncbi:hypothetical protein D3C74_305440 [compost metagenome]
MRGGGVIIMLIVGVILGFRALYRLWIMRRFTRLLVYVIVWFGYPFIVYGLFKYTGQIDDLHKRMWILGPIILSLLFWLVFGFMANKKVDNIVKNVDYKDKFSGVRRIIGIIVSLTAIAAWFLGYNSFFGYSDIIDILTPFLIGLVFIWGAVYTGTGKPFNKWDD